jgi:hypothetical protein
VANYVQTTFFTPKDTLPTTNPAKTIFGSAYDVEFGNISAAIATKYDNTTTAPSLLSLTVGTPTGGNLGAGSINAQSISVNNVAVLTVGGGGFVSSITGTANQITASASTGAVTLSLPQNVVIPTPANGTALTVTAVSTGLAIRAIAGPIEIDNNLLPLVVLNASGANFGFLQNQTSASWSLAYGGTFASLGTPVLTWTAAGGVQVGAPTGGDQGAGTINATGYFVNGAAFASATTGSFTAGTTGLSGATIACNWTKAGTMVVMRTGVPSTEVSSTTGFTITGLPAAIQPTTAKYAANTTVGLNNSSVTPNITALVSGSTITLGINAVAAAWTASGNKTVGDGTNGAIFVWDTN